MGSSALLSVSTGPKGCWYGSTAGALQYDIKHRATTGVDESLHLAAGPERSKIGRRAATLFCACSAARRT
ncbi:hypothetical protein VFPFJ_10711 [Purpureocillium lilacinum]|uniref:Uncharacterized protein n=1 Tax=Purpureocillium lilacinum TaxID=33203 RepID=A0A179GSG0_PURLI|nr:hypothetical protein VFPFJ_10711 [Purpureocillium lilacinum]OAQ75947.1 hypothetical protein VFPFJ_10711 [Purpureocillium lilacinum]OAQ80702.1 hypothetical protein VFPBJ_06287 [Purpureocillium lilacinum]